MALAALALAAVYGWAEAMLARSLRAELRVATAATAAPHASSLGNAINERLVLVRGLVAFVTAEADEPGFERKFATYARTLRHGVHGIRNIGVAPDFVVRHIDPVEGNEKTIGHDFLADPRPGFIDEVRQAIRTRDIVTHGPLPLIQGGEGLIARHAVFLGDRPWGAVGVVFDLQPVLDEANIGALLPRHRFALRKGTGPMVAGDPRVFGEDPVIETIHLPDGTWELAVVPARGWSEAGPGWAFPAGFLTLSVLVEIVVLLGLQRRFGLLREIRDRTENERLLREARDAAQAASRAKSRFLAAASHDLRQPVHTLRLLLSALEGAIESQGGHADPEARELVDEIEAAVLSLSDLLNALLDVSRLDAGVVVPTIAACRVGELLRDVALRFQRAAAAAGVRLSVVPSSLVVRTDPVLLARVLDNLVANAVKFAPGGRVLVGCRRRDGGVEIQVADTGIGIPDGMTDAIFEEFRQLGNDARQRSRGLGLGLAIVRRTADLLGHPVGVRSARGRGSVFSVTVRC